MPWARHQVLAVALSGGTGGGTYPRRGLFSIGGYADLPLLDSFRSNLRQSGFRLRGYQPAQFAGNDFNLLNVEYRAPLWYADRGVSTLPVFVRTLSGAVFFDYGAAYDRLDFADPLEPFHGGVGAELWLDLFVGYYISRQPAPRLRQGARRDGARAGCKPTRCCRAPSEPRAEPQPSALAGRPARSRTDS